MNSQGRSVLFLFAFAWLAMIILASLLSVFIFKESALTMDFATLLDPPSWSHWMGTDSLGRDVLARVLMGGAVSLLVALLSVLIACGVGLVIGIVSGYAGGWIDRVLMGVADAFLCFPVFFLILAAVAMLGTGNIVHLFLIIGFTSWMGIARLARAEVLSLKEKDFIFAARALGAQPARIMARHLLPNALGPVGVQAVIALAAAILTETGLSFLGVGVSPPTPSWGNILMDGKSVLGAAWWVSFFPGLMIFLTTLAVYTIGHRLEKKV